MTSARSSLENLANAMETERGPLNLLGLFQRDGAQGWELVFGAPWVEGGIADAIRYVNKRAPQYLSRDEASRITMLVPLTSAVNVLADMFPGPGDYFNFTLNDIYVSRAIIARLRQPSGAQEPAPAVG
jgi:hypothetical protein